MADKERELGVKIVIDNVSNEAQEFQKLDIWIKNIKKDIKELEDAARKGIASKDQLMQLAAYNKTLEEHKQRHQELKKVMDSAPDSLNRMRAELIKLKGEYGNASAEIREKMAPAINKLNDEILKSEKAIGSHVRNVGNYPNILGEVSGGFNQLSGAIGGTTAAMGDVATSFFTGGGVVGALTAGISLLATAWKTTKENIEKYLESADKVKYGDAAFTKDSKVAWEETVKRAKGGISEGGRLIQDAHYRLLYMKSLTEEEKAQLNLQIQTGIQMRDDNIKLLWEIGQRSKLGVSESERRANKLKWQQGYNKLLAEEEKLNDEKLEKETKWEELEANLVKQRAIVSDQQSTELERKQATIDADKIANTLVKEKTEFLDRQIANVNAIADMTGTQEVVEDRVNGLMKERNSIQREYYSDQVKINKLENAADKVNGIEKVNDALRKQNDLLIERDELLSKQQADKQISKLADEEEQSIDDVTDRINRQLRTFTDNYNKEVQSEKIKHEQLDKIRQLEMASFRATQDSKVSVARSTADLITAMAGKQRSLQKAALIAEKSLAIAEVIINTTKANTILRANAAMSVLPGPLYIPRLIAAEALVMPAIALNKAFAALNIVSITATTAAALAGFNTGGKINRGIPVNTGTKDNLLIAVNNTETVLTDRQVAMLGGSRIMKRIGVPGYATGGYVGADTPNIQPTSSIGREDFTDMANRLSQIEVVLNVNKLNSAQNELNIINQTQRL